jgi:Flp pilus assembly protein TadG
MKSKKGAAIAELAIVLPILLVVFFAIAEFGLILYDKAMVTNASREGARAGIVFRADPATGNYSPFTTTDITTTVNSYLASHLVSFNSTPASATTTVSPAQCPPPTATPPRQIAVTVTYPYTFLVLPNLVAGLVGVNPLNITAVTVMRCE